jgi:hypothetical protein
VEVRIKWLPPPVPAISGRAGGATYYSIENFGRQGPWIIGFVVIEYLGYWNNGILE